MVERVWAPKIGPVLKDVDVSAGWGILALRPDVSLGPARIWGQPRWIMAIYRVYAGPDGESHIEPYELTGNSGSGEFPNVAELNIHQFSELRSMPFHPLPERRLIFHLTGQVEIGVSDGGKQVFGPGDARLMEDTSGKGHTHQDLSPVVQAVATLSD